MKGVRQLPITLLYAEDDDATREAVSIFLKVLCERVLCACDGLEALKLAQQQQPQLLITDIRMSRMGGLELVEKLRALFPLIPVVITTAFTDIPNLLKAIQLGVCAFVRKPLEYGELERAIRQATLPVVQRAEIERLTTRRTDELLRYLGGAACLRSLLPGIVAAVEKEYPVVIEGERGCGKAVLATLLHRLGDRSRRPCIEVSCRSADKDHLETELLGGKRWGTGRITAATDGTIILCGLEEMPLSLQVKLLKILEKGCFYPQGEISPQPVACRIIATVGGSLEQSVALGQVDRSLANHLSGQVIALPPLREYGEDFTSYSLRFLAKASAELYREPPLLEPEAMQILRRYRWPGNLRELKQIMRDAARIAPVRVSADSIKKLLSHASPAVPGGVVPPATIRLDELERWALLEALQRCGGRKMLAAQLLGIDYKRFKRKLSLYVLTPS